MLSGSFDTECLLIAVLGAYVVLLVIIAWRIETTHARLSLYLRRACRLVIAKIAAVGKMDCDELSNGVTKKLLVTV